jgi:hypothetical protein
VPLQELKRGTHRHCHFITIIGVSFVWLLSFCFFHFSSSVVHVPFVIYLAALLLLRGPSPPLPTRAREQWRVGAHVLTLLALLPAAQALQAEHILTGKRLVLFFPSLSFFFYLVWIDACRLFDQR